MLSLDKLNFTQPRYTFLKAHSRWNIQNEKEMWIEVYCRIVKYLVELSLMTGCGTAFQLRLKLSGWLTYHSIPC